MTRRPEAPVQRFGSLGVSLVKVNTTRARIAVVEHVPARVIVQDPFTMSCSVVDSVVARITVVEYVVALVTVWRLTGMGYVLADYVVIQSVSVEPAMLLPTMDWRV
ncbi:hypothetical protein GWI34_33730 [Actinomadura sp. DSM 109109]|nr:hypothetical protein [Actinomadura lepetitiana]